MPKTLNDQRLAQILTKVKAEDDSVREEVSDLKSALQELIIAEETFTPTITDQSGYIKSASINLIIGI